MNTKEEWENWNRTEPSTQ